MSALRIAILWHHHQPMYRVQDEFVLPWVRLHAIKDYLDLAALQLEFPSLRLSYNIVPSLLMQLDDYLKGIEDRVLSLTKIAAEDLSVDQKREILQSFFRCQIENMVQVYPRYCELYQTSRDEERALAEWTVQEWRDLQVWYNLCWHGPLSRQNESIQKLFRQQKHFTEEQKRMLLAAQRMILLAVVPMLRELHENSLAELSMTPLYHPIMPLVIDTEVAQEASPDLTLPAKRYRQQHDAEWHLRRGQQVFEEHCNTSPRGVWCSEGSLSDETLELLVGAGVSWTASDEQVLRNTKAESFNELDQYFVHWFARERRQSIAMFFRDHHLSDAIGFVYQKWNADDAAHDFITRLKNIRERIIKERGIEALNDAVVPIILDGENCWEYYTDNGIHFLRALYTALSSDPELRTVTFQQVVDEDLERLGTETVALRMHEHPCSLQHIVAGSWINANFRIWIGHPEKNAAWQALHEARLLIDARRVTKKQWRDAMEHIYIAEGSDWFWWYGDDHQAETRSVFDEIFRFHLRQVYEIYREDVPEVLKRPLMQPRSSESVPTSSYSTMHAVEKHE